MAGAAGAGQPLGDGWGEPPPCRGSRRPTACPDEDGAAAPFRVPESQAQTTLPRTAAGTTLPRTSAVRMPKKNGE
jgi:hypothetical protein